METHLDEGSDDTKGSEAEIFEWACFGCGIKERV